MYGNTLVLLVNNIFSLMTMGLDTFWMTRSVLGFHLVHSSATGFLGM